MIRLSRDTFSRRFRRLAGRLSPDGVDALLGALDKQDVAAGEAVIVRDQPFDALLLVWDGSLNVVTDTAEGERELAQVGPGSYLGEASLLDPGPASATVMTEQGCTVLRLERTAFDDLCVTQPAVANVLLEELSRVLASRVRAASERLDDLIGEGDGVGVGLVGATELVGVTRRLMQDGPGA